MILAAGESKRMGEKKELLPVEGVPMVRMVVEKVLASWKVDEVIVVLGDGANEVGAALSGIDDGRIEFVGNQRYAEGMGTSLAAGVRACSWGSETFVVVLADAPFFSSDTVDALIDANARGGRIAVPVFKGRRGHPVLLDGSYREELEALSGDAGARDILERDADEIVEIEVEDDWFLVDIDSRDDYEAVKDGLAR